MTPTMTAMPVLPSVPGAVTPRSLEGHALAYLVGIGGAGMCGAAELLRARGLEVAGSDLAPSPRTDRLVGLGIRIDAGEGAFPIPSGTTLVVASAAVPATHPQLVEARRRGLDVWKYAELLGALMEGRTGICVAGCHGKTTTSSLVATTLWRAGRDPSFVIGGEVKDLGTSARAGAGPCFVAEACEYDRSFHRLRPTIAVVTNIDVDHLDYYRDLEEIRESFREFARLLPAKGLLVVHEDHAATFLRDPSLLARLETYGTSEGADWQAVDARFDKAAQGMRFTLVRRGTPLGQLAIPLSGLHNVHNATGAAAALLSAGCTFEEVARGLAAFGGVGRRLESIADRGGVTVLDDYGHHPTEIAAVIRAVRTRFEGRRLLLVFQPHQASRTHALIAEFAEVLAKADEVWLPPIYLARDSEEDRRRVSSEDVALRICLRGGRALTFPDLDAVVRHAAVTVRPGDVVVTMGAGNVDEVARGLASRLR